MGLNPIPIAVGPAETVAKYVALYDNIQHSVRCDHDIFLVGVLILGLDCLTDTVYLGEMLQDFGCLFLLVYLLAAQYQFVMTLTEQLDPVDDLIVCSQYRRSVPPLLRRRRSNLCLSSPNAFEREVDCGAFMRSYIQSELHSHSSANRNNSAFHICSSCGICLRTLK